MSQALTLAMRDVTRVLESLRKATMADSAGRTFWDDGAFGALAMHLDYFQQLLLEEIADRMGMAAERHAPVLTMEGNAADQALKLSFTVAATPYPAFLATLARRAHHQGDYLATIFHTRNFLRALPTTPDLPTRVASAGGDLALSSATVDISNRLEQFVSAPVSDTVTVVTLAAAALEIIDLIASTGTAQDPEPQQGSADS